MGSIKLGLFSSRYFTNQTNENINYFNYNCDTQKDIQGNTNVITNIKSVKVIYKYFNNSITGMINDVIKNNFEK